MVIFLTVAILMIAAAVSDRLSLLLFYKFSSLGRETFQITAVHRPDLMTAASHLPKTCLATKTHFLDGLFLKSHIKMTDTLNSNSFQK